MSNFGFTQLGFGSSADSAEQVQVHVHVVLYTGTGSEITVTGVPFKPGAILLTGRDVAEQWFFHDAINGSTYHMRPDYTTGLSAAVAESIKSYTDDGFVVGTHGSWNTVDKLYVAYCFYFPTVATPSTAGSVTPSNEILNVDGGFSIMKWTSTGGADTIGHNQGTAPGMFWYKDTVNAQGWFSYHTSLGPVTPGTDPADMYLQLNLTSAQANDVVVFDDTEPTSTVITTGTVANAVVYMGYLFAEVANVSKISYFTGDGNATQQISTPGITAQVLLIKVIDGGGGSWVLANTTAGITKYIALDGQGVEVTDATIINSVAAGSFTVGSQLNVNNVKCAYIALAGSGHTFS